MERKSTHMKYLRMFEGSKKEKVGRRKKISAPLVKSIIKNQKLMRVGYDAGMTLCLHTCTMEPNKNQSSFGF